MTDRSYTATEICSRLSAWAEATGIGALTVSKSDLLWRIFMNGEMPSKTPCPVHKGKWVGCHGPWPGWASRGQKPDGTYGVLHTFTRENLAPSMERDWYDAGCRCALHYGSSCTTGWQPDEACGCLARTHKEESVG